MESEENLGVQEEIKQRIKELKDTGRDQLFNFIKQCTDDYTVLFKDEEVFNQLKKLSETDFFKTKEHFEFYYYFARQIVYGEIHTLEMVLLIEKSYKTYLELSRKFKTNFNRSTPLVCYHFF